LADLNFMALSIMLDVDGVVVCGRPSDGKSWSTDIECDLGISVERLNAVLFRPYWDAIVTGEKQLLDVLEDCLPTLHPSISPHALIAYWFRQDARIDVNVIKDCDTLRKSGLRVFLTTNQEHLRAHYLMNQLGLSKHVDGIVYSAQVGAKKPDPAFFDAAAQRTGLMPAQHILIDDMQENVAAAIAGGWQGLHWTKKSRLLTLLQPFIDS
jgi:putative hydrolase of the HAD superfamily